MCFKGLYDSTDVLFTELGLLKFNLIKKYFLLLNVFKDMNNKDDVNTNIFTVFQHGQGTRGNNINLVSPQPRTTLF